MRRNFGSLNLAALDLPLDAAALHHLQQHHDKLTRDLAELHVRDDDSDAVGFPIELFAQAADDYELAHSPAAARRRKRSYSEHAPLPAIRIANVEMRSPTAPITGGVGAVSSSLDTRAHPHHAELHALRCLSLNLMLSTSLPVNGPVGHVAVTAPQPSTSMPKMELAALELGCQPHSDRVASALLAARRTSLPRNMIQSA